MNPKDLINAWNTHSADKLLELYAEDAELRTPDLPQPLRGKQAIRQNVQSWLKAFPDVTGDIGRSIVSGNDVALLVHFSGTHRGEFEIAPGHRIAPTNRKVESPMGMFLTLDADGKIKAEHDVMDMARFLQQLQVPAETVARIMGAGQRGR